MWNWPMSGVGSRAEVYRVSGIRRKIIAMDSCSKLYKFTEISASLWFVIKTNKSKHLFWFFKEVILNNQGYIRPSITPPNCGLIKRNKNFCTTKVQKLTSRNTLCFKGYLKNLTVRRQYASLFSFTRSTSLHCSQLIELFAEQFSHRNA